MTKHDFQEDDEIHVDIRQGVPITRRPQGAWLRFRKMDPANVEAVLLLSRDPQGQLIGKTPLDVAECYFLTDKCGDVPEPPWPAYALQDSPAGLYTKNDVELHWKEYSTFPIKDEGADDPPRFPDAAL